jgi:hypothetical protein
MKSVDNTHSWGEWQLELAAFVASNVYLYIIIVFILKWKLHVKKMKKYL